MVIGKTETVVKSGDLNLLPFRRALEGQALYVGITGATDSRGGTERMGNAALAALHARGAKVGRSSRIPARPFLISAMEQAALQTSMLVPVKRAIEAALLGKQPASLQDAGRIAASGVKAYFTAGNAWERNAPYTVQQKGFDMPLIRTGTLRNAITYRTEAGGGG